MNPNLQVEQVGKLSLHQGSIYALVQGDSESTFLSAGSEGLVVKYDLNEQDKPVVIARVNGQIFSLLLVPEKNHLIIGTMSGGLHIVDLNLKKEIHYITFHEQSIFDIRLQKNQLLVASKDGTLSIWSTEDYSLQRVLSISNLSLRMIAIHPSGMEAAVACSDNQCYLIDLEHWKIKSVLSGPENSVFSVCYAPDGMRLLAGSRDAQLYLFDLKSNSLEKKVKAHLFTINHLQFISGDQYFATASRDKTIRIWNAADFELLKSLDKEKYNGHINSVNRLLWMSSRSLLISASDDRSVIIWKIS